MKRYEAMFLFDPAVTAEWEAVKTEMSRLLDRAGARVIVLHKWDERRLAYEIRGRKRAIYALTYFEADPMKIADLERDARLSEAVLRCMVTQANHLTDDEMKEISLRPPDYAVAEAERTARGGGGYRGGGGGGGDRGGDRGPRGPRRDEGGREPVGAEADVEG